MEHMEEIKTHVREDFGVGGGAILPKVFRKSMEHSSGSVRVLLTPVTMIGSILVSLYRRFHHEQDDSTRRPPLHPA